MEVKASERSLDDYGMYGCFVNYVARSNSAEQDKKRLLKSHGIIECRRTPFHGCSTYEMHLEYPSYINMFSI